MTDQEKIEQKDFHVRGGYLKTFEYKEAWKNFWRDTDEENRKKFLALPNFDWKIFTEITGIEQQTSSCDGKVVEIDGKKYLLKEI